jgi:hypothetical protein
MPLTARKHAAQADAVRFVAAKDRIIDQLERLADEYGCNEF